MHISSHLEFDVVALESDDSITVMLDLEAPDAAEEKDRPSHTVVVVLDRSGSMGGGRLDAAQRALIDLVGRLDGRDSFGLVVFDDATQVVVPAQPMADLNRDAVRDRIRQIAPGGATDLSSGYLRGLQEARRAAGDTGATLVLLSDGHANRGVVDPEKLRGVAAGARSESVTTSTIGIGLGYDEALLAEIATGGSGNHSFAEESDSAAAALAAEVDGLLSKTVQAASVKILPGTDVKAVKLYNDLPAQPLADGLMVELGDFYAGEKRRLLVSFDMPGLAALGLVEIARLEFTYVQLPGLEQHTVTVPIAVNVVPGDQAAGRIASPEVQRELLFHSVQEAKREAEDALRRGNVGAAKTLLDTASTTVAYSDIPLDERLAEEVQWLNSTSESVERGRATYSSKRLRSDRTSKTRGYSDHRRRGEIDPES